MHKLIVAAACLVCMMQFSACAQAEDDAQAVADSSAGTDAGAADVAEPEVGTVAKADPVAKADRPVKRVRLAMAGNTGKADAELPSRIVMMWQVTGKNYAKDFPELKALGVNVVQSFSLAKMDPDYVDGYLAAAAASGIGLVINVAPFVDGKDADCALSPAGESFIQARAASPAVLAWHTADEAATHGITKECQVSIYRQVKKLDPHHLVMVSVNFTQQKDYDGYFDERAFDFIDLHRYVNTDMGPSQQRLIDVFRKNRKRDYRVIVTLRAFNAPEDKVRPHDKRELKRKDMGGGVLDAQYDYFFRTNRLGDDIGFYGWRLSPNLGISQVDWMKAEFTHLMRDKIGEDPSKAQ